MGGGFAGADGMLRRGYFQATVGVGRESTTYQKHGRWLEGELQAGAERHQYWTQEASMLGLPLRNWYRSRNR